VVHRALENAAVMGRSPEGLTSLSIEINNPAKGSDMTSDVGTRVVHEHPAGSPQDVAARVLFAFAAVALAVAVAAVGVLVLAYYVSYDEVRRSWPEGIAGWLICIPSLLAALVFAVAGLRMRRA
jgi:hypothetical protein